MIKRLGVLAFACAVTLAACGGGGGGTSGGGPVPPPATNPPAPSGNLPLSENVSTGAAWVNPSNHKTLYFLDVDTATTQLCTGGCLGVWPVFAPVAGSTGADNMTIITRSDGTGQQWAYQGHPLYTYTGDNGPDQANGEGVPDFGGHWHVARPAGSTATPPPGDPGNTCHGYC
jgi:predicted lipoprotein with Yx(FWY)xxD motif